MPNARAILALNLGRFSGTLSNFGGICVFKYH